MVLNASGRLELGADPGYPMRINRDAQVHLAQSALPLMRPDDRVVLSQVTKPTSADVNLFQLNTFPSLRASAAVKTRFERWL